MATASELTTRIAALETAIQELAVNLVAEYYIGPTRVRYHNLPDLRSELASLQRQLSRLQNGGGITKARFTRT